MYNGVMRHQNSKVAQMVGNSSVYIMVILELVLTISVEVFCLDRYEADNNKHIKILY